MRVSRIGGAGLAVPARNDATLDAQDVSPSRALVAVEPTAPHASPRALTRHPAAPFLAQVIATHLKAPQTRARRRATPAEAIAAYRSLKRILDRTAA